MKAAEKYKIEQTIQAIESGCFNTRDIDYLFIALREYSRGCKLFREIGDFIAHPKEKNKGVVVESLQTMHLVMRFFIEYTSPKKVLNLELGVEKWIYDLLLLQLKKCDAWSLQKNLKLSRKDAEKIIKRSFKKDDSTGLFKVEKKDFKPKNIKLFNFLLSFISGNSPIHQDDLINEIITVLRFNKIKFDSLTITRNSDKIAACIICTIHNVKFDYGNPSNSLGLAQLSCERLSVPYNVVYVDQDGNEVDHEVNFGLLNILGFVQSPGPNGDVRVAHSIFQTNLKAEEWCDSSMFYIKKHEPTPPPPHPPYHHKIIDFEGDFFLNNEWKLEKILGSS